MNGVQIKIAELDLAIRNKINPRPDDLKIAMSVPGIEFTSAATILAEIGDYIIEISLYQNR